MKAEELRLGNWVDPKFPMQVVCIYKDEILCNFKGNEGDVWEYDPKDLDGIPLTYEWLTKFGFEKLWHDDNGIKLPYYRLNKNDYLFNLDYEFCATRDDAGYIYVKYVHQLQNLYFALTGKEL